MPTTSIEHAMSLYISVGRLTNPQVRFVGISLNTSALTHGEASRIVNRTEEEFALPCVDPIRARVDLGVEALGTQYGS
jgi:uncharacterized NAD-dependent epimerase/dehydratase family protein